MSDRLLVATRKGLFVATRRGGEWRLGAPAFLGQPVSMALHDPRDGALYAALALGHFGSKLHRSTDGGASWAELAAPAYPEGETAYTQAGEAAPASLSLLWSLEACGADDPGALWAGTIPGGLFRSADRGESWTFVRPLWDVPERRRWFGGGYDFPGIHSICVDPRDSRRLAVAVSCGGVWLTEDRGASWTVRTKGLWAEYMPPEQREDPAIQDPHRMVQCRGRPEAFWMQHHNGVFRSTDGLASWQEVTPVPPANFGFAAAVHPADPDTAWLAPAVDDSCRVPVDGRLVVSRTRDGGRSFEVLSQGLPRDTAYDLIYRHAFDVAPDGRRLAMGSTTGTLWLSEDQGDSWAALSLHLPPVSCVRFA